MHKYNGESLTTYEPRGPWSKIHTDLSSLGSIHISNVHILANLEPFRWGSPDFVQKAVQAMHNVHGANALHLYPQASYWDWPYTADKLPNGEREFQLDRDWIWYQTWGRYAWNSGIVPMRSVTGIINWDSSTEHPTRMQAIFALLMKKAEKLLRSYYAVLVSRKETVRRYCWGCL